MKVQLIDKYTDLPEDWDKGLIEECCDQEDKPDTWVADCCYRDWNIRLRTVNSKYQGVSEVVRLMEVELATKTVRRDRLKTWYEELTAADELVHKVCNQLEHIKCHVKDICDSTDHTSDAVLLLFCMIRDLYGQIDQIKQRYDDVVKCIECLDDPVFIEGEGLLLCLKEYYTSLDAIIKTRDDLMALTIKALDLSNQLYNNVGAENDKFHAYGLNNVLHYWKRIFKCRRPHKDEDTESENKEETMAQNKGQHHHDNDPCKDDKKCIIEPAFDMPFCENKYYEDIKNDYEELKDCVDKLQDVLAEKKEEEKKLLACKESLEKAKDLVDPKARC